MIFKGIAGSDGIGIGSAVILAEHSLDYSEVKFSGRENERLRLAGAVAEFREKTRAMWEEMKKRVGEKEADILSGQIMMIDDPFMVSQMNDYIDDGRTAEAAVDYICQMYIDMFSSVEDELTRQRATDIRDIRTRILKILLGVNDIDISDAPVGSVLVAADFTPSMTVGINKNNIAAIITEIGGKTSHSAILARALEIPAVLGAAGIVSGINNGEQVIADGFTGEIITDADPETFAKYEAKRDEHRTRRAQLQLFKGKPTVTADGIHFDLYGNIGKPKDATAVREADGEGIGLFRTEFLFMDRTSLPTEEEQFDAYRDAAEAIDGGEVIIRTLDIGGDKDIPYLEMEKEDNPFLGCRAIRFCLSREDIFRTQLKALLRASAYGNIKIMLPLISCVDELRRAKEIITELKNSLDADGISYNKDIKIGVMIETPAAAVIADILAKEADFFSIGTNDLTGYTMAVDRGNSKVANLYSTYNPAVIRLIKRIIECAHEQKIPVGMCGESAADPLMIPLLIAFGLDEFSVSPSSVLAARRTISLWTEDEAKRLSDEVLKLSSVSGIEAYLKANAK